MAAAMAVSKFDPNCYQEGFLEAFMEFGCQYNYSYEALGREPPASANTPELKAEWQELDKRKIFLGKYEDRNLQKRYEDLTSEAERSQMTFTTMMGKFRDEFRLNSNMTLANFKFRALSQGEKETYLLSGLKGRPPDAISNATTQIAMCWKQ